MKKTNFSFILLFALFITSCANSISDVERIYRHGIERAERAQSTEELSQITIDVRNELIEGAKGIGGDRILSDEEMHRYNNAQHSFKNAIDKRYYELTGSYGTWGSND